MNVFTKRNAVLFGVFAVGIGLVLKHARDPKNADSFVTGIAKNIGLVAA